MLEGGVVVSDETIRRWYAKFGQAYANQLRRRWARPGDKWHLDEVFIPIRGREHYLRREVDQHGNVLEELVQPRRNRNAAKRFFRKLLERLALCAASNRHRQARQPPSGAPRAAGLGRASPIQVLEQSSRELASTRQAARTGHETVHIGPTRATLPVRLLGLSAFSGISPHFQSWRHRLPAPEWRTEMTHRFAVWQEVTATGVVA
jgi:putative transposase